jgi:hypothetical protein
VRQLVRQSPGGGAREPIHGNFYPKKLSEEALTRHELTDFTLSGGWL